MSWENVRLDDLCKMNSGGTPSRSNLSFYNGQIPWAKISDIENADGGIIKYTEEHISSEGLASINNRIFSKGILLLAMYGSVGKVAFTGMEMATNQAILGIQIKDEKKIDYSYLKYWFQTIKEQLLNRAVGVALQNISLGIVKELEIPLPPLHIQKSIVEILDAADALKRKDQALLKKYDELAQAIFIDMFGDPVKNEKGWEVKKLEEICDVRDGTHDSPKYYSNGYPLVTSKNIKKEEIDFSDINFISKADYELINKRSKVDWGDILMPMIGTIGNPVIVDIEPEFAIKNVALIKNNFTDNKILTEVLYCLLSGSYFNWYSANNNKGGTQKFLSLGDIRNMPVIVPSKNVQIEFVLKIKNLKSGNNLVKDSYMLSNCVFNSLIQKAFKGELVK